MTVLHRNRETAPMSIRDLARLPFTLLARLNHRRPREETFSVEGSRKTCHVPLSLAAIIVENIDVKGIYQSWSRSDDVIRLDGCALHELAERGIPGLTWEQRQSLAQAGAVGLESGVYSIDGDVLLTGVPVEQTRRAQERGATIGFRHTDAMI